MTNLYLARQSIVDIDGTIIGYELLFRDSKQGIINMPSNISATAKLLYNSLNHMDISDIAGQNQLVSINCDHAVLLSGFIDLLDSSKFYLELLETTDITPELIRRVVRLKSLGFRFALDDFDCVVDTYKKFEPIMEQIDIIKICLHSVDLDNCHVCMEMFTGRPKILLAEKIETKEEYDLCVKLGFSLFQGYYISKPEILECVNYSSITKTSILKIMNDIKHDADIVNLMSTIKSYPEVVMQLFKFANNKFSTTKLTSLKQILILMGRKNIIRWCLISLHAGMKDYKFEFSAMDVAISRANKMEMATSGTTYSTQAYIVGLVSALAVIYEVSSKELISGINFDDAILNAINDGTGPLGEALSIVIEDEKDYLWDVILKYQGKLTTEKMIEIIYIVGETK